MKKAVPRKLASGSSEFAPRSPARRSRTSSLSGKDRCRIGAAYDFAEQLRLRRNEAAHTRPTFDFDHGGETEEFLVSAGRHLPALWLLWQLAKADYVPLVGV